MATKTAIDDPVLWTAEDVARVLRCEPRTVRRKTKTDGLPFIRTASNRMLFDPAKVRRWLEERATTLDAEPRAKASPGTTPGFAAWDGVRRAGRKRP